MKIFVTGGTGFVGSHLVSRLRAEDYAVTVLSRSKAAGERLPEGTSVVQGDPTQPGSWQEAAREHDCIINLAALPSLRDGRQRSSSQSGKVEFPRPEISSMRLNPPGKGMFLS